MNECREAFEKWYGVKGLRRTKTGDEYLSDDAECQWQAWQAAWAIQQTRIERLEDEILNRVLKDEEARHA